MDVLNKVHHWLRPQGFVLDLHPEPAHPIVQVMLRDGTSTYVGRVDITGLIANIHKARAALAAVVQARRFEQERTLTFDFVSHFASVDEWLAYREAKRSTSLLEPAVVARARELLSLGDGIEVLVGERVLATRLRRLTFK